MQESVIVRVPLIDGVKASLYYGIDAAEALRLLPEKSVHMVATSPPYWDQRDYEVKGQLGAEATVEEFVTRLVSISREIYRVLRQDGTYWLNLGDRMLPDGNGSAGIPWIVAEALRADGWLFVQMIIWEKPNARPDPSEKWFCRSHEYILLLAKTKNYFFDAGALLERVENPGKRRPFGKSPKHLTNRGDSSGERIYIPKEFRYMRSVWPISTQSFAHNGEHYATFPSKLVENMIKAGSSLKGCCPKCANPWKAVVQEMHDLERDVRFPVITGWEPTCTCKAGLPIPCTVLDPFSGSGTTGMVALNLNRDYIGIDLNPNYLGMAVARISGDKPGRSVEISDEDNVFSDFRG